MRRPLVAGNWKMNGSKESIASLLEGLKHGLPELKTVEVAVCPPFLYVPEVSAQLSGTSVAIGAQNVADQVKDGAFTAEISGGMLKEFGCTYAIVGHSERRSLYGETDALVAKRFAAAQAHGLVPILCVGETLEERESGVTERVVARQLDAVLALQGIASFGAAVLAYEPVWAIGTGKTATPEQAQEVHAFIRRRLAALNPEVANALRILYGGSVKGSNAAELMAKPDIDGGLIGGAALIPTEFLAICRAAD